VAQDIKFHHRLSAEQKRCRAYEKAYAEHMVEWTAWFDQLLAELPIPLHLKVIHIPGRERGRRVQDCITCKNQINVFGVAWHECLHLHFACIGACHACLQHYSGMCIHQCGAHSPDTINDRVDM
jgi:hypothetical protein